MAQATRSANAVDTFGAPQPKWKAAVDKDLVVPLNTQEVMVLRVDWYDAVSILQIHLNQLCSLAQVLYDRDCIVH